MACVAAQIRSCSIFRVITRLEMLAMPAKSTVVLIYYLILFTVTSHVGVRLNNIL